VAPAPEAVVAWGGDTLFFFTWPPEDCEAVAGALGLDPESTVALASPEVTGLGAVFGLALSTLVTTFVLEASEVTDTVFGLPAVTSGFEVGLLAANSVAGAFAWGFPFGPISIKKNNDSNALSMHYSIFCLWVC
jgi:hypothetical protein